MNQTNITDLHKPDQKDIRQHLEVLFHRCPEEYPGGKLEIRCIHPVEKSNSGNKLIKYQQFKVVEDIAAAVKWAVEMNGAGFNVYVGVNPRKPNTAPFGAGSNEDVEISFFNFADIDNQESVDRVRQWEGTQYTFSVTTGSHPCPRPHLYWELETPNRNMKAWTDVQAGIADMFKSDRVIDPARIMGLAGTVNYPDTKKSERGYRIEVVQIRTEYDDDRDPASAVALYGEFVNVKKLAANLNPANLNPANLTPGDRLGLGNTGSVEVDKAVADILAGREWHNNMIRVVGHWMSLGRADWEIIQLCRAFTLPGFTHDDTDKEVMQAIEGGHKKGYAADANQPVSTVRVSEEPADEEFRIPPQIKRQALKDIPKRGFLYGKHLIRGFAAATISPGGVGKTTVQMIEGVAMVANKPLLGVHPNNPDLRCMHINLEDPQDELDRRYYAILAHFKLDHEIIGQRYFTHSGRTRKIIIAEKNASGMVIQMPDLDMLRRIIRDDSIDVLSIDPIVKCHYVDENDNKQIDQVMDMFNQLADDTDCALDLASHVRKSPAGVTTVAGDINQARGASSLAGAVRSARTLTQMTAKEAESLNISLERSRWYVREDDAKGNMSPPTANAKWMQRVGQIIANGGIEDGDDVGVLVPWKPPDPFDGVTVEKARQIINAIDLGPDPKEPELRFSPSASSKKYWVGNAITENALGKSDEDAKMILKVWFASGVLFKEEYRNPIRRTDTVGIFVNLDKMPEVG